jgi:uracil-DNA glycosylase family protein
VREIDTAAVFIPAKPSLPKLRLAAASCTACPLFARATQTVFGEGRARATWMLVGEQPGNSEDLEGRPFVGPAGALLDHALGQAGIERKLVYVTNVVKHFKWEPRGKRRIHKRPNRAEVRACFPWLESEIEVVKPHVIVCLGATAAQALLGSGFRVSVQRAELIASALAPLVTATVHPSSILRARGEGARALETKRFVADLIKIRKAVERSLLVG